MKVLILDFNEDFYPIYERKLREIGNIQIFFAKDLEAALSCLADNKPDCILLNHLFYDKLDYYTQLRSFGFTGDIIIVIAGKESIIRKATYSGISGILDKSLNVKDFRKNFCNLLNLSLLDI